MKIENILKIVWFSLILFGIVFLFLYKVIVSYNYVSGQIIVLEMVVYKNENTGGVALKKGDLINLGDTLTITWMNNSD